MLTNNTITVPYADEVSIDEAKKLGLFYEGGAWRTSIENIVKNIDVLKLMPSEQVLDLLS